MTTVVDTLYLSIQEMRRLWPLTPQQNYHKYNPTLKRNWTELPISDNKALFVKQYVK